MKRSAVYKPKSPFEQFHEDAKHFKVTISNAFPKNPIEFKLFNEKQNKVYNIVKCHLEQQNSSTPLRLIVQGCGGTGKSTVIKAICSLLKDNNKHFRVCSFTGNSAFLVGGYTIHRAFRLPMYFHGSDPHSVAITDTGKDLEKIEYFIFDEMSLIGLNMLGYLSERLKAVHRVDTHFGNQNIVLMGDFSQIRPVGDRVLFSTNEYGLLDGLDLKGFEAYQSIPRAVVLDEMMRQSGRDEEEFRNLLLHIRRGKLTDEDQARLESRYIRNLSVAECSTFAQLGVVFFFAEKIHVHKYNMFRVGQLETVKRELMSIDSDKAPPDSSVPLVLAVGARVFLNVNIFIEAGLYNGALGTVTEFGPERQNGKGPECVYVKFDRYWGPRYGIRNDIPITRKLTSATSNIHNCSWRREQFLLELAFSLTCHKSQGTTLDKVVIGIPESQNHISMFFRDAPSIFYVAISRVRSINDVALSRPFRREIVVKKNPGTQLTEWMAEETRLRNLELVPCEN